MHEQQPANIVCDRCRDGRDPHYMHVCGFDMEGRPILYSVFNLAENRGIEENRRHMLSTFEQVSIPCCSTSHVRTCTPYSN